MGLRTDRRRQDRERRDAEARAETNRRADISEVKASGESLPLANWKVGGIFTLDDRDGLFVEAAVGIRALDVKQRRVIYLASADDAEIDRLIEKGIEDLPWAQRSVCQVCCQVIMYCTCNRH